MTLAERAARNFDHPDSLDTGLLRSHIEQLKAGHPVDIPIYDFTTHSRTSEVVRLQPRPIIIVDGKASDRFIHRKNKKTSTLYIELMHKY